MGGSAHLRLGDIELLADRFPAGKNYHGFEGEFDQLNWPRAQKELRQMQTQTAQTTPFDFIDKNHFESTTDREAAKALFKRSVSMVEIEVFSYCN